MTATCRSRDFTSGEWFDSDVLGWLRRRRLDDLSDEIQSHIDEKTDPLMASGMLRADAETAARRAFGNMTLRQGGGRGQLRGLGYRIELISPAPTA